MPPVGREITHADRSRILRALRRHKPDGFEALRTAALVHLAWGGALRISECVALDVDQVAERRRGQLVILESSYVRTDQAKGGRSKYGTDEWTSAGPFVITPRAREALRAYLREAMRRGWLELAKGHPLLLARHDQHGGHGRLTDSGARKAWRRVQRRAGIDWPYRFHDLRHDAITRFARECNGNPFQVAKFARLQHVTTVYRYLHQGIDTISDLASKAEVEPKRRDHYRSTLTPR